MTTPGATASLPCSVKLVPGTHCHMHNSKAHLESLGGEVYCHIFENENTGLQRGLFWSVTLDVNPPTKHMQGDSSSISCEWMRWSVRNWQDLCVNREAFDWNDSEKEASLYWLGYHAAKNATVSVRRQNQKGSMFHVHINMDVVYTEDSLANLAISTVVESSGIVPFTGLIIVPENIGISRDDDRAIDEAVAEYVDPAWFHKKQVTKNGYIFKPKSR